MLSGSMSEASDLKLKNVLRLVFGRDVPMTEIAAPPGWGDRMVAVAPRDPELPPRLAIFYYSEPHMSHAIRAFTAMRALNRCGFPVPRVYYAGWGYQSGMMLLLADYAPGRSCEGQPQPFFARIQQDFGRTLADIHRVLWDELPDLPVQPFRFTLSEMARQTRELGTPELVDIVHWLAPKMNQVTEAPYTLLHGEYILENVFAEGTEIRAIWGWENAGLGDPRFDIGLTSAALGAYGLPYADQFLEAYQVSAGPVEDCALWEVLGALRLMVRLATGLVDLPPENLDEKRPTLVAIWRSMMSFIRSRTEGEVFGDLEEDE